MKKIFEIIGVVVLCLLAYYLLNCVLMLVFGMPIASMAEGPKKDFADKCMYIIGIPLCGIGADIPMLIYSRKQTDISKAEKIFCNVGVIIFFSLPALLFFMGV